MQTNMYSSRGGNAYGQQSYTGQSAYGQNLGSGYSGSNVGGPEGSSQLSIASRHSSMLGASSEADGGPYRGHPSATAHYSSQYSSVYGTATLSSVSQVSAAAAKAGSSTLEGRGGYGSAISDSPKFSSGEYAPTSSHGYGNKSSQLYGDKVADYPGLDRRQYGERQSSYMGREMQADPTGRYADSVSFAHQHQNEIYDRIDQAVLIRQEQLLKSQTLQSSSLDGNTRDTDYLAARSAASRHPTQDLISIGGRIDSDSRGMSMLSASSYNAPSILGAAPRRNVDDLIYSQSSSNPNYGISLPPGREYAPGKAMHMPSLDPEYPMGVLPRGGHSRLDERKDDRASYLREFELREEERRQERLRDRERDREKEKERERLDRERERERERERTRERLRARERERERILEQREERDRERQRGLEIRRERSPLRLSRDRRGSSLLKDGRLNRRDSPQRELSHRRRSPVKEKRREYVCKVYTSSLVDVERDYLSLDKRYPRLFISPEFSKAVVYWPKENLKLSIHTPVSFVHDFLEEESSTGQEKGSDNLAEPVISGHGNTIWNAKVILMSGISKNSLEELSSERNSDDRIPHLYNILRFAVFRKDHSFQAIGGPWDSVDGGDPSVDDTSLIRTAQRHVKEIAQLDLQNCRNWNRFLEIHYDRVGKDGLFSHKEITVLFVPDLSECLPSLDLWRSQWLAHQKAVAEQERRLTLRRERMKEKEAMKEKADSSKDVKRVDKEEKKIETTSSGKAKDDKDEKNDKNEKISKDVKGNEANDKPEKKDPTGSAEEVMEVDKKEGESTLEAQTPVKGKKKIIRKIVKQKVVAKKTGDTSAKDENEKEKEEKGGNLGSSDKPDASSATKSGVKTFVKKKPGNVVQPDPDEGKDIQTKKNVEKEVDISGSEPKDKSNSNSGTVSKDTPAGKTVVKKKIIKRVPKRKIASDENPEVKREVDIDEKNVEAGDGRQTTGKQNADAESRGTDGKISEKKVISKLESSKARVSEKIDNNENSSKVEVKTEKVVKKEVKGSGEKSDAGGAKDETQTDKKKASQKDIDDVKKGQSGDDEKSKDEKEKKGKDSSDESRSKLSGKEVKDKKKVEEPPRHPGFVLQTKWSRDSRMRSPSLALETLLDYSDKDVEESTFEISLFAETLCEMFQYQMGCRVLTFLLKLRVKFVRKRSQQKRRREEKSENEKEKEKMSPTKRLKTDDAHVVKNESTEASETVMNEENNPVDKKDDSNKADEPKLLDEPKAENGNDEEEEDPEEDPEEEDPEEEDPEEEDPEEDDPEEDEEMDEANPQEDVSVQNDKVESEKEEKIKVGKLVREQPDEKSTEPNKKSDLNTGEKLEAKLDIVKKVTIDKDLLQAFRYFDRNQAGYVRVEDLRSIIHNLGKFLSHRDVKELVQSALLESNTGRDDRILYNKLVRIELQ